MLEVVDKGECTDAHPAPLLFVHGAWHAAWCWDEYFTGFFADKGYRALAVSLRGHGNSGSAKPLKSCSLADYVDDVASVANNLPVRPVLVGHSMGGLVVQKYLERYDAPAAVLVASVPRRGSFAFTMRLFRRHPWLFVKASVAGDSRLPVGTADLAREWFFSPGTADADVVRFAAQINGESQRIGLDGMVRLPNPKRVRAPLLVLGAGCDRAILPREVHATAGAYGTEAVMFPGMGHDMMLEPGWESVADHIHSWLGTRGL